MLYYKVRDRISGMFLRRDKGYRTKITLVDEKKATIWKRSGDLVQAFSNSLKDWKNRGEILKIHSVEVLIDEIDPKDFIEGIKR